MRGGISDAICRAPGISSQRRWSDEPLAIEDQWPAHVLDVPANVSDRHVPRATHDGGLTRVTPAMFPSHVLRSPVARSATSTPVRAAGDDDSQ